MVKTAPETAVPMAKASCRPVPMEAEAVPSLSRGTAPIMAEV
jgi:hypothetical protein